jgi:hypothetical protein
MKKNILLLIVVIVGLVSCEKGIIALKDCPQKMDDLNVELSQNEDYVQTIKITKDGELLQELKGDTYYQGTPEFNDSMVYYIDANYDGYTDIYIGTGEGRTSNTILLWNSDKDIFEIYGEDDRPSFQNPYFSPSEKAIYTCGGNGLYDFGYSKYIWKDGKLIIEENLDEILFREGFDFDSYNEFNDYKRTKKYTLLDSNNKLITETDDYEELPNKWCDIVLREYALRSEEFGDYRSIERLREQEAINKDENIKKQLMEIINEENGREVISSPSKIEDFKKEDGGKYWARFYDYGEYFTTEYAIREIVVDKDGIVQDFEIKSLLKTPTDKVKPTGGGINAMDQLEYYNQKLKEGNRYNPYK